MGLLDIVDEQDNIIGKEDFIKVHSEGLRHRSVQIFVFEYPDYRSKSKLLVAERSGKQETSSLKLHPSAGGHVRAGQTYLEAAIEELREELFYDMKELPHGFTFNKVGELFESHTPFYKNDTRQTNKENTILFLTEYSGPFLPNPNEINKVFWQNPDDIWKDMKSNQNKYTQSFRNALLKYMFMIHE